MGMLRHVTQPVKNINWWWISVWELHFTSSNQNTLQTSSWHQVSNAHQLIPRTARDWLDDWATLVPPVLMSPPQMLSPAQKQYARLTQLQVSRGTFHIENALYEVTFTSSQTDYIKQGTYQLHFKNYPFPNSLLYNAIPPTSPFFPAIHTW